MRKNYLEKSRFAKLSKIHAHCHILGGFTIIEVSFFLALSGLLAVGVIAGTASQLARQRYNDSTQNFLEFLRGVYAEVNNPENSADIDGGRSSEIILGKLISFGDPNDANGIDTSDQIGERVYTYTILADDVAGSCADDSLSGVRAELCQRNAYVSKDTAETYLTTYSAKIESITKGDNFTGFVMIIHSPSTGAVNTYASSQLDDNKLNESLNANGTRSVTSLTTSGFSTDEANFCIYFDDSLYAGRRRNIRILENAHNETGIAEIDLDSTENKCGS